MPQKSDETVDLAVGAEPKKPGRPSSGISRSETFKRATKANRQKKIASGKVELKCFVTPSTKEVLAALKVTYALSTVGEVIDFLAQGVTQK